MISVRVSLHINRKKYRILGTSEFLVRLEKPVLG